MLNSAFSWLNGGNFVFAILLAGFIFKWYYLKLVHTSNGINLKNIVKFCLLISLLKKTIIKQKILPVTIMFEYKKELDKNKEWVWKMVNFFNTWNSSILYFNESCYWKLLSKL